MLIALEIARVNDEAAAEAVCHRAAGGLGGYAGGRNAGIGAASASTCGVREQRFSARRNVIKVVHPYKDNGVWVFDDETAGLVKEPFVSGVPDIVERMVRDIAGAAYGFTLYFSDRPFKKCEAELIWVRGEYGGNWYRLSGADIEGWLCPALYCYFSAAPQRIYCRAEPRTPCADSAFREPHTEP